MLASLLAVATHPDSTLLAANTAKTCKQGKTPASRLIVDDTMVQAAIASALTKFDDLEASFATHGHVGTASILTAEVLRDADLELPAEEDARKAATKQVSSAVLKRVGMAFGAWQNDDDVSCVVCLARPRAVVILPCRHLSLCALCAADVPTCPMCRGVVEDTMHVFV